MMGPSTMPPVMARACCRPMIAASKIGNGSLTAKNGGSLSVVSFLQYGHLGCKQNMVNLESVRLDEICPMLVSTMYTGSTQQGLNSP